MTTKKLTIRQKLLVAGTLFGMFFGAGNLIFPVHLGQMAGRNAIPAMIGFIITAVGIPVFGVAAIGITHSDGLQTLAGKVSKGYGIFFTCLLYLTIGPLFAIPRCATVSFTTGVAPMLGDSGAEWLYLLIFSAVFFAFVLFFSLRPGKITVWIGKIINPIFLIFFAVLMIAALALSDMVSGIFKGNGMLGDLLPGFEPRWRPMFTPSLEGLEIAPDTLMRWRFEGHATPGIVHVPEGALGGKFGTVSSHAATVVALLVLSAAEIRRRWFTFLMVAATLLICYSRIYLAKHFPVDLLLGAAVGALTGWAMLRAYRCIGRICRPPLPEKRRRRA